MFLTGDQVSLTTILTALASFLGTAAGVVVAWRASWKTVAEMHKAEAQALRDKLEKAESQNVALRRDYHQTLEFNMQDRRTIELLADELVRLCGPAQEDAAALLYAIRLRVMGDARKRKLLESVHTTEAGAEAE